MAGEPLVRNPLRDRPSKQEYANVDAHREKVENFTAIELMRHDAQVWEDTGTLGVGPSRSHKNDVVENLFKVARYGGLLCSPDPRTAGYKPWPYNLASCISHGGRVLIQIAKVSPLEESGRDNSFWQWFRGQSPLGKRVGTHSVKRYGENYQVLPQDRLKYVMETGGAGKGAKQFFKQLIQKSGNLDDEASYGMNIAFGGFGNTSEARQRPVTDDGTFGHMYFFYIPPSHTECGAILIGVEGEEPGKWGETGNFHSYNIGAIDSLRTNKPNKDMGLPTGPKWEAIGERYETLAPSKKGGMFVDCSGLSARRLAPLPFNWKMVHTPATPLRLKAVDAPLPQTNQSSLDPIRKSYMAIPSAQIQARMDKLAAYRDAVKKLKMPPLLKTVNDAIKTLNTARDQA